MKSKTKNIYDLPVDERKDAFQKLLNSIPKEPVELTQYRLDALERLRNGEVKENE